MLAVASLAGCQFPRDPDGTLDRVEDGVLRVGVTPAEPWVELGAEPTGVEVELVRRFARDVRADVQWTEGSEEELMGALREGQLDLVIGGLTAESPWEKEAALTRPYLETKLVVGVPAGSTVPDDLDGVGVAVEEGTEGAGLLEQRTEAVARRVPDLGGTEGPAVVGDWQLDDLGLQEHEELETEKHVMAAKLGENAFLVRLERFLLGRDREVRRVLEEEGRP